MFKYVYRIAVQTGDIRRKIKSVFERRVPNPCAQHAIHDSPTCFKARDNLINSNTKVDSWDYGSSPNHLTPFTVVQESLANYGVFLSFAQDIRSFFLRNSSS